MQYLHLETLNYIIVLFTTVDNQP